LFAENNRIEEII